MTKELLTKDFAYHLPEELIAQHPLERRDRSRLMVLDKGRPGRARHFDDLPDLLSPGDCLVVNNTKVIPARLIGSRQDSHSRVEVLLLKRQTDQVWECLVKPGRRCRPGHRLVFMPGILEAEVIDLLEGGNRLVRFDYKGIWEEVLDRLGTMPLPPYIHEKLEDSDRYQTVYAKYEGSAAAPTAGLHFTPELIDRLKDKGITFAELTLHVGLGTFRPVKSDKISDHQMHSEFYQIDRDCCDQINRVKQAGGRVIAVGTTACRVLETVADDQGHLQASSGETDIFIYPGYRFKLLDGLITNFHLSESTLLMLVSAFYGRDRVLEAYKQAVAEKYRFYSFGDAMLLLPESKDPAVLNPDYC